MHHLVDGIQDDDTLRVSSPRERRHFGSYRSTLDDLIWSDRSPDLMSTDNAGGAWLLANPAPPIPDDLLEEEILPPCPLAGFAAAHFSALDDEDGQDNMVERLQFGTGSDYDGNAWGFGRMLEENEEVEALRSLHRTLPPPASAKSLTDEEALRPPSLEGVPMMPERLPSGACSTGFGMKNPGHVSDGSEHVQQTACVVQRVHQPMPISLMQLASVQDVAHISPPLAEDSLDRNVLLRSQPRDYYAESPNKTELDTESVGLHERGLFLNHQASSTSQDNLLQDINVGEMTGILGLW